MVTTFLIIWLIVGTLGYIRLYFKGCLPKYTNFSLCNKVADVLTAMSFGPITLFLSYVG